MAKSCCWCPRISWFTSAWSSKLLIPRSLCLLDVVLSLLPVLIDLPFFCFSPLWNGRMGMLYIFHGHSSQSFFCLPWFFLFIIASRFQNRMFSWLLFSDDFLGQKSLFAVSSFVHCRWWKKYFSISLVQIQLYLQWFKYLQTMHHLMVSCCYWHFSFLLFPGLTIVADAIYISFEALQFTPRLKGVLARVVPILGNVKEIYRPIFANGSFLHLCTIAQVVPIIGNVKDICLPFLHELLFTSFYWTDLLQQTIIVDLYKFCSLYKDLLL